MRIQTLIVDELPSDVEPEPVAKKFLEDKRPKHGQFYELNGLLYRVKKIGQRGDVVLEHFSGVLTVERIHATATMIQGARRA